MSLRYTGEATMDEPALRDVERWKDKIEVRLDNRQVFFLFFGSAMVACMLFVLGVIVGKRLESRGRAEAPVVEDPLAALDRFGGRADTGAGTKAAAPALTFPRALLGSSSSAKTERTERVATKTTLTTAVPAALAMEPPAAPTPASRKLAALPRPIVAAPTPPAPATAPAPVAESHPTRSLSPAKPMPVASSQAKPVAPQPAKPSAVAAMAAKPSAAVVPPTKPVAAKPVAAKAVATAVPAPTPPTTRSDKTKGGFALQLSSFQDRAEADAFARRFASQNAHVVVSEIPGKGTWYRVRVGSYGNMKEAASAKASFEHDHGVIAYVAGSGPAQ